MAQQQAEEIAQQLISFLKTTFQTAGFTRAVIAVSGGVDSATSCALAVRALGSEHVYPLLLPYGDLNQKGTEDARLVIQHLNIPEAHVKTTDIEPLLAPLFLSIPEVGHIRRGNAMARMRMMVLYDLARSLSGLVVGTENKTEHLLGYFTRFGDEASDVEPLRGLYKTQVYGLATYLGIPEPILTKAPTAGLWDGQTDEGEFGFTYKQADEILSLLYDEKKSVEEIIASGFDQKTILAVKKRVEENEYKHKVPYYI